MEDATATSGRPSFWLRHARRPAFVEISAAVLLSLWVIYSRSDADAAFVAGPGPLLYLTGLFLCALWFVHALVALALRSEGRLGPRLRPGEWAAWLVLPVLLASAWVAVARGVPLRIRWRLSADAFEDFAARGKSNRPERLGLFSVERVDSDAGALHIGTVTREGLLSFDSYGFVRLPEGPPKIRDAEYRPFEGDWYVFCYRSGSD